jgi:hypothetical protein
MFGTCGINYFQDTDIQTEETSEFTSLAIVIDLVSDIKGGT